MTRTFLCAYSTLRVYITNARGEHWTQMSSDAAASPPSVSYTERHWCRYPQGEGKLKRSPHASSSSPDVKDLLCNWEDIGFHQQKLTVSSIGRSFVPGSPDIIAQDKGLFSPSRVLWLLCGFWLVELGEKEGLGVAVPRTAPSPGKYAIDPSAPPSTTHHHPPSAGEVFSTSRLFDPLGTSWWGTFMKIDWGETQLLHARLPTELHESVYSDKHLR